MIQFTLCIQLQSTNSHDVSNRNYTIHMMYPIAMIQFTQCMQLKWYSLNHLSITMIQFTLCIHCNDTIQTIYPVTTIQFTWWIKLQWYNSHHVSDCNDTIQTMYPIIMIQFTLCIQLQWYYSHYVSNCNDTIHTMCQITQFTQCTQLQSYNSNHVPMPTKHPHLSQDQRVYEETSLSWSHHPVCSYRCRRSVAKTRPGLITLAHSFLYICGAAADSLSSSSSCSSILSMATTSIWSHACLSYHLNATALCIQVWLRLLSCSFRCDIGAVQ